MLEINANLRYSLKRVLANLKKSEWQASEKYLTCAQCNVIVRGAAPVSREEGSFELDPWNGLLRLGSYYDGLFEERCHSEEMDANKRREPQDFH